MNPATIPEIEKFSKPKSIDIASINSRPAKDVRVGLDTEAVQAYAENIDSLPALLIIIDEKGNHWLADGYHRYVAHMEKGLATAKCKVKEGTYLEAYRLACHANEEHGVRTTNEDKRRRVEVALSHPEMRRWSTRKLADACGVSNELVCRLKPKEVLDSNTSPSVVGIDGKQYPATKPKAATPAKSSSPVVETQEEEEEEQEDEEGQAETEQSNLEPVMGSISGRPKPQQKPDQPSIEQVRENAIEELRRNAVMDREPPGEGEEDEPWYETAEEPVSDADRARQWFANVDRLKDHIDILLRSLRLHQGVIRLRDRSSKDTARTMIEKLDALKDAANQLATEFRRTV